jgi:BRCA1-associated protein
MRGYHVIIRVTIPPTPTTAKTPTKTSAAWATNTFVPKSIFESLPSHTPRKTSKKNAILGSKRRDYRYGPIRIDWLDLKSSTRTTSSLEKQIEESKGGVGGGTMDNAPALSVGGNGKEKDVRTRGWAGADIPYSAELTRPTGGQIVGKFAPKQDQAKVEVGSVGRPHGSTNLPEGVVHIFRESPPRPGNEAADESHENDENKTELGADDNTLAVLAVPAWMTPSDFLSFVEPAAEGIVHLRMIR